MKSQESFPPPVFNRDGVTMYQGDCRELIRLVPDGSIDCCVTSPPYWGLRDYGHANQIGLEETPQAFVDTMVNLFREVRRAMSDRGTLWLNLGDTYNSYSGNRGTDSKYAGEREQFEAKFPAGNGLQDKSLKPKDLVGIPWRVALALQADGWYLRQDIVWHKPNPMPESVTDRCTKSHEYIFLLAKSERYHFDCEAIKEAAVCGHLPGNISHKGEAAYAGGDESHRTKGGLVAFANKVANATTPRISDDRKDLRSDIESRHRSSIPGGQSLQAEPDGKRNKRSVWTVPVKPYKGAHFATYPAELIEPCILAGCPEGGTVLDPFIGSGTTAAVARRNGCKFVGFELNAEYLKLARKRFKQGSFTFDKSASESVS